MAGPHHEADWHYSERLDVQAFLATVRRCLADAELILGAAQRRSELVGIELIAVHLQAGVCRANRLNRSGREHVRGIGIGRHAHGAGHSAAQTRSRLCKAFRLRDQLAGGFQQRKPGIRDRNAPIVAGEQFNPELIFQRLDAPAESRLRQPHSCRSLDEAERICECSSVSETFKCGHCWLRVPHEYTCSVAFNTIQSTTWRRNNGRSTGETRFMPTLDCFGSVA